MTIPYNSKRKLKYVLVPGSQVLLQHDLHTLEAALGMGRGRKGFEERKRKSSDNPERSTRRCAYVRDRAGDGSEGVRGILEKNKQCMLLGKSSDSTCESISIR